MKPEPSERCYSGTALWSRRGWMKSGLLAGGAYCAGSGRAHADHAGTPLRLPADWSGGELVVTRRTMEVWPGRSTTVLAVNGSMPGPTIRLRRGERFEAVVRNQLPDQPLVLHWHGLLAPAADDGHPNQGVAPGQAYEVGFDIVQDPATCWYHAHTHDHTAEQVYRGLAGLFLIEDPERDEALGLPTGERDVPLVIRDWKSNAGFEFTYNPTMFEHMWGFLGDRVLVNGTPDAWLSVDQGLWRFRMLNGCNARVLRIGFADGRLMRVIAGEGGLTGMLEPVAWLDLAPGQRVEVLVSFADVAVGASAVLRSLFYPITAPAGGAAGPRQGNPLDIMTFHIDRAGGGGSLPAVLPGPDLVEPGLASRTRLFALGVANGEHTINGQVYDLDRIDFEVPAGEVEIWEFVNQTNNFHPMHVHGVFFRVLTRNGVAAALPADRGWRDTVLVYPNETVRVALAFGARRGEYLMHCHNLEHEHQMMMNFLVAAAAAPDLRITREAGEVVCRWRGPSGGWQLESSDDLVLWLAEEDPPVLNGGVLEWRSAADEARRFFRLALP
jgi:FtsP/CotA-like multicopper oxidase with cupredoxin domain